MREKTEMGVSGAGKAVLFILALAAVLVALKAGVELVANTAAEDAMAAAQEPSAPVEELPDADADPFDAAALPDPEKVPAGTNAAQLRTAVASWAEASGVPRLDDIEGGLVFEPEAAYPDEPWVWLYTGTAANGTRIAFEVTWEKGGGYTCSVKY